MPNRQIAPAQNENDHRDAVGRYLDAAGRVPLLSAEEEIALAKEMERGKEAADRLAAGRVRSERTEKRLREAIEVGERARRRFLLANLRLVVSIAKKYQAQGLPLRDVVDPPGRVPCGRGPRPSHPPPSPPDGEGAEAPGHVPNAGTGHRRGADDGGRGRGARDLVRGGGTSSPVGSGGTCLPGHAGGRGRGARARRDDRRRRGRARGAGHGGSDP